MSLYDLTKPYTTITTPLSTKSKLWDLTVPYAVQPAPPAKKPSLAEQVQAWAKAQIEKPLLGRPTVAPTVKAAPTYHGVGEMRREYGIPLEQMTPYPYAVGQAIKGAVAPLPVPAQRIAPPRSQAEAALGAVAGMAGTLIGVPGLLGGMAAGAVPILPGAARLGTITATQLGQKALGGEKVTAKEAGTALTVSLAAGAAGDLVAPFVNRSISTTLAKHFPEVLSPTMEKALPYIAPAVTGAGAGAARGVTRQVAKWVQGEPISIGSAIAEVGAEAALGAVLNVFFASVGLAPKGETARYYRFAKVLIENGANKPDAWAEFTELTPGVQWRFDPKTAKIHYQFTTTADQAGQLIPSFLSQAGLATVPQGVAQPTGAAQAPHVTLPIPLTSLTRAQAVGQVVSGAAPSAQAGLTTRPVEPISQPAPSPAPSAGQIAVPGVAAAAKEPWQMTREELAAMGAKWLPREVGQPPQYKGGTIYAEGEGSVWARTHEIAHYLIDADRSYWNEVVQELRQPNAGGGFELTPTVAEEYVRLTAPQGAKSVEPYRDTRVDAQELLAESISQFIRDPRYTERIAPTILAHIKQNAKPNSGLLTLFQHEAIIKDALAQGKPVPANVLADYPDLAAKYGKPTPPTPPAGRFPGAGRVSIVEPTGEKPPAVQTFAGTTPVVPKGKPTAAAQPVKRSDVVKFLSEKLGVPIRVGRYVGKAPGIFKVKPEVIRTRIANNLAIISHEVGHYLDKVLDLDDPKFDAELQSLGKPAGPNLTGDALRREGTAEFVRLYLTDPDKARTGAPSYFAEFETRIGNDPQVRDTLLAARQQISDWANQPAAARISAAISVGEKVNHPTTWDGLYTKLVDELRPLEKVVKELTGGEAIPITKDPFKLAWLARGCTGKAETFLHHAVLDQDFKKIGDSLESILKPMRDNLEDVRRYITAKRALELEARGKATGIDPADAKEFVDGHPKLEKIQKALVEFQDEVLDQTLVRSGIISKTAADAMRKMNQEYVPFYRVFDESRVIGGPGGGRGYANLSNPVKRLKGSEREIIDPLESIIKNTYAYVTLAARNDVGKTLADLAEATEGGGKWVERVDNVVSEITPPAAEVTDALESVGVDVSKVDVGAASEIFTHGRTSAKENVLRVFVNGEPQTYQVDPGLYPALLALDRESVDILTRILSIPAQVLRAGAVLNPSFILRNPARDQVDAYLFSKYGYKPIVDLVRGMFHVVKKDDLYWKAQAAGGMQSTLVSMDRDYLQGTLDELLKTQAQQVGYYASHPIEVLRALSEWGEAGTRMGEFALAVKANPTTEGILEGALAMRDVTVDFARRGSSPAVKWYRRMVPFFNATIQGTDKLRRAMRDNPKQFVIRALTGITLTTLATYLMCRKNNRYKELPSKEKDMYWHIPTGTDPNAELLRIPKPHEAGIIFGSLPERIWGYIDDRDPSAFDGFAGDLLSEMLPSIAPQLLVGYYEAQANKRFYSGTPIIPAHEEDLPPEMQYGPYTPETLKWLGEQFKLSPRLMEHYVSAYGGGLADTFLDAADWAFIQLTGIEPTPQATQGAAGIPGIGSFVTSTAMSQSVDELYNEYDRLTKEETRAQAKRQPMVATDRVKLARVKSGYSQMSGLQKRRRAIEDSRTMTPEVKKEQLEVVQRQMVEVARRALGKSSLNPGK